MLKRLGNGLKKSTIGNNRFRSTSCKDTDLYLPCPCHVFDTLLKRTHTHWNTFGGVTLQIVSEKCPSNEKMRMNQSVIGAFHVFRNGIEQNTK